MVSLTIKQNRIGPIINGHPWVFSKAFVSIPEGLVKGEPVKLVTERGDFLASGYFSSYSAITVRIWGKDEGESVNEDFFIRRIKRAYHIRQKYVEPLGTNAYRLIHGESDLLPGLIVDKYENYLVVQFHTEGIAYWKTTIVKALENVIKPKGIYERSDVSLQKHETTRGYRGILTGAVPDLITINENGLKFLVDVKRGQKTGFFLDQRDKRKAFLRYAHDTTILNCFSYTGSFAVYALAGGAQRVTNVDTSQDALSLAKENILLNGFDINNCTFVCEDAKRYLSSLNEKYDVIILDPPAFIRDRKKKQEGIIGYKSINEMALHALSDNGILITCSCSAHLSLQDFRFLLSEIGGKTKKLLTLLECYTHGIDHYELVPFTEGEYLKCFFIKVH